MCFCGSRQRKLLHSARLRNWSTTRSKQWRSCCSLLQVLTLSETLHGVLPGLSKLTALTELHSLRLTKVIIRHSSVPRTSLAFRNRLEVHRRSAYAVASTTPLYGLCGRVLKMLNSCPTCLESASRLLRIEFLCARKRF